MNNDIGTLAELGVKSGDVVGLVSVDSMFKGNTYTIQNDGGILNNNGAGSYYGYLGEPLVNCKDWKIISRASQEPKTWGQMTDEEKGALLLAKHEGKVIEWINTKIPSDVWETCPTDCLWDGEFDGIGFAYRIKPEPVVETVVMYASDKMKGFGLCRGPNSVHKLTFKKIDGETDYTTVNMSLIENRTGEKL